MPRKKSAKPELQAEPQVVSETPAAASTATAEYEDSRTVPPVQRPAWIDGPVVAQSAGVDQPDTERDEPPKHWGNPYKPIFSSKANGFEMGENRRFKQRVFIFSEKPDPAILQTLKDNGFTYRAAEKAWTIPANPDTRKLSEELAYQFAGQSQGMSR